jgi:modification methylase
MPRIPFGSLVEQGLIAPGTTVFDRQRRVSAMVGPDGSLSAGDIRGSIHKVGALLQNAPSCNGWTFWHFERDGTLMPLDTLRAMLATQAVGMVNPIPV